jgi:hypothetical protein
MASWGTACFSFYLLTYYVKYFEGSILTNGMILGGADILAAIVGKCSQSMFSTKTMLVLGYMIAGLSGVAHFFVTSDILYQSTILLMRFGIELSFFFSYYANIEYFPTDFVSTAFGACNFVARSCAMLAPLTVELFS